MGGKQDLYRTYTKHFSRTYELPDYKEAISNPNKFVIKAQWLPENRNARILDFGSGWGHMLLRLYISGYKNLYGIDTSSDMCEIAKEHLPKEILIECVDDEHKWLASHQGAFDLVILNNVIEHIPVDEVVPLLSMIRQSLVPGGSVFISTPNMASIFGSYTRYVDLTHVTGYTEFSLFQLLDLAGFEGHRIVQDGPNLNLSLWAPWRCLGLAYYFRQIVYWFLLKVAGPTPRPTCYRSHLDVVSYRPREEGNCG